MNKRQRQKQRIRRSENQSYDNVIIDLTEIVQDVDLCISYIGNYPTEPASVSARDRKNVALVSNLDDHQRQFLINSLKPYLMWDDISVLCDELRIELNHIPNDDTFR